MTSTAPSPRRALRIVLIVLAVALVVIAAGLAAWAVFVS